LFSQDFVLAELDKAYYILSDTFRWVGMTKQPKKRN
jgi:hypothetical protein